MNDDIKRAVLENFDAMAACEPEEAILIVMKQSDGHQILEALNDPLDGEPHVEKTYAKTTPPQHLRIKHPGMMAVIRPSGCAIGWMNPAILSTLKRCFSLVSSSDIQFRNALWKYLGYLLLIRDSEAIPCTRVPEI